MPIDALCRISPDSAIGSHQRVDLSASELDSLVAEVVQRSERIVQESKAILFVGDQPTHN
jgi:hypothetical protein